MYEGSLIKLWKKKISNVESNIKETKNNKKIIFPSARQALTEAIMYAGVKRHDRIAVPEWITDCVTNSISKVAMVIPLREVICYSIPVKAILLYEQWGWTMLPELKDSIMKAVKADIFIVDRVDSADINNGNAINFYSECNQIELYSLSKVLGTKGGGIVKYNRKYIEFAPNEKEQKIYDFITQNHVIKGMEDKIFHIMKSEISGIDPYLKNFISKCDLKEYYKYEATRRRENTLAISNSNLSSCWNDWMFKSLDIGAAPGIVPLFKGYTEETLSEIKDHLKNNYNIITGIYNFNWSGNPLDVDYQRCIAFPAHSDIHDIESIIKDLERKFSCK